ncbi:MAG: hypothetical protein ACRD8A_12710 [Candidatus Acidiferrales bacterium]
MFTPEVARGTRLRFWIGVNRDQVVLDFGMSLSHLEMGPDEAEKIAELLVKHASNARAGIKSVDGVKS